MSKNSPGLHSPFLCGKLFHTVASNMIADGIDLVTAANELGHADPTTTAKIYAHQIATAKAKASKVRSNVFSRAI